MTRPKQDRAVLPTPGRASKAAQWRFSAGDYAANGVPVRPPCEGLLCGHAGGYTFSMEFRAMDAIGGQWPAIRIALIVAGAPT
jgi:hypothetical protein